MTEEQGASEQVESEEVKGGSGGRGLHTHGPGCLQLARVAKRLDTSLSPVDADSCQFCHLILHEQSRPASWTRDALLRYSLLHGSIGGVHNTIAGPPRIHYPPRPLSP